MRFAVFAGTVMVSLTLGAQAFADGTPFGGAGQLAITDDQPLGGLTLGALVVPTPPSSFSGASFEYGTVSNNGGTGTAFVLAPAADFFVTDGVSLGASIVIGVLTPASANSGSSINETVIGFAPRVGYDLHLTDAISFWPKVFFSYATASTSGSGDTVSISDTQIEIGVFAPFMFEPARHFLVGIGPNFFTVLSNNTSSGGVSTSESKVTQIGLQLTIGGWCLGRQRGGGPTSGEDASR